MSTRNGETIKRDPFSMLEEGTIDCMLSFIVCSEYHSFTFTKLNTTSPLLLISLRLTVALQIYLVY